MDRTAGYHVPLPSLGDELAITSIEVSTYDATSDQVVFIGAQSFLGEFSFEIRRSDLTLQDGTKSVDIGAFFGKSYTLTQGYLRDLFWQVSGPVVIRMTTDSPISVAEAVLIASSFH